MPADVAPPSSEAETATGHSALQVPPGVNEALLNWDGALGLPRFEAISPDDFAAAFDAAMAENLREVDAIASNTDEPTFENTMVAMERAGEMLGRVGAIFWTLAGNDTNDAIQALERDLAPKMARHSAKISMNEALFGRIDALYEQGETLGLTEEQHQLLDRSWKSFVRSGAKLEGDARERLKAIQERLAELGTAFAQNMLADERDFALPLMDGDLDGLPDWLRGAMRAAAKERGTDGYAVTLARSIIDPFLTHSTRRDLRERAMEGWTSRGLGAVDPARNNRPIVREIVALRAERASLLGFPDFASFKLDTQMAKTPDRVQDLLDKVWERARARAREEEAELQRIAQGEGANHAIAPHDWRHYAEKLRAERFDFDDGELKPYLSLDRVRAASFDVANRLFGVSFVHHPEARAWHPDANVWEVLDRHGQRKAVFCADDFARPSKRSGAWMSALRGQSGLDGGRVPIVTNTMNFAKPPEGEPALLSMDDARTLFHEFGHALHGMLSDVTYPSLAGTAVARDFVELPSQLYEHWLTVPQVLSEYALHVETGEPMPQELLDKVLAAQTHNAGFETVEFTASALVDLAFHRLSEAEATDIDPMAFQAEVLERIDMPDSILMRHATPHFAHVFSGDGYSAGYYSYMWSEVMDADAFAAFEEVGDPFDREMAERLARNIYSAGGSRDPEVLYEAFRGRMPTPDAMLEKRGLS